MLLSEFVPGEEIEVKELKAYAGHRKKWISRQGKVVQAQDRFIVIDYGNYRGTVSFGEIKCGNIKIVRGNTLMANKIMTKEKLTELCREHGFGKVGYEKIAEILGMKWRSVEVAVSNYGIRKEIEGEQPKEKKPIKTKSEKVAPVQTDENKVNEIITEPEEIIKGPVKFYIASRLENSEMVQKVSVILKHWGWLHTYDWTKHGSVQKEGENRIREVAENEIKGVKEADIVIVLLPGGRGTHAELGAANILDKPVLIWGATDEFFMQDERTCAFYWNNNVKRVTGDLFNLLVQLVPET